MRLPLEAMHGLRSSPDEGNHTHRDSCGRTIDPGDVVVGCSLEQSSTVFDPDAGFWRLARLRASLASMAWDPRCG
jgi:hypothetical protein